MDKHVVPQPALNQAPEPTNQLSSCLSSFLFYCDAPAVTTTSAHLSGPGLLFLPPFRDKNPGSPDWRNTVCVACTFPTLSDFEARCVCIWAECWPWLATQVHQKQILTLAAYLKTSISSAAVSLICKTASPFPAAQTFNKSSIPCDGFSTLSYIGFLCIPLHRERILYFKK